METGDNFRGYAKLSIQSMSDNLLPSKPESRSSRTGRKKRTKSQKTVRTGSDLKAGHLDHLVAPKDQRSRVYVAFILSGIGYMLPYTTFIVAVDYYQSRFPQSTVIFDMTTATIMAGTVGVILNNAILEALSLTWRVMVGYVISSVLLLFLTICDVSLNVFHHSTSYWVTLLSVAVMSVGCSVQQSSFYGYANMLPRRYTQAVMVGESFAGVIVSINRITTKLLVQDEATNTIIFFVVSMLCIFVSCVTFLLARHTHFVKHHLTACRADKSRHITQDMTELKLNQSQFACFEFEVPPQQDNHKEEIVMSITRSSRNHSLSAGNDVLVYNEVRGHVSDKLSEGLPVVYKPRDSVVSSRYKDGGSSRTSLVAERKTGFKAKLRSRLEITKQIYPFMASFGLTFFVSVSLYPGIVSEVVSCRLGSWMPVVLMACFNVTDALGKTLTSFKLNYSKRRLLLCSLSRICFIPLAMLCCQPRLDPVLSGEAWPILVTLFLGGTNGYFGSLPLVLAPSQVPPRHRELCGNIMMMSFTVGIMAGAVTSYGLDLFIGPHPDLHHCENLEANVTSLTYDVINATNITGT